MKDCRNKFKNQLIRLGHSLAEIEFPWRACMPPEDKVLEITCSKCGTIFTINGGWYRDQEWYAKSDLLIRLHYWVGGDLMWEYYTDITCDECIIMDVIK